MNDKPYVNSNFEIVKTEEGLDIDSPFALLYDTL